MPELTLTPSQGYMNSSTGFTAGRPLFCSRSLRDYLSEGGNRMLRDHIPEGGRQLFRNRNLRVYLSEGGNRMLWDHIPEGGRQLFRSRSLRDSII